MSKTVNTPQGKFINDRRGPVRNLGTYSNVINDRSLYDILFSTTEMNFVDKAAYPDVAEMEQETVRFLLNLAENDGEGVGFATTGSSEAIVLALAWHKVNFLDKHPEKKEHQLNYVVNEGYHKAFDKFATLFGVELRKAPLGKDLRIDVAQAEKLIDENTFCLVGIAGSTEIGMIDDIRALNKLAIKRDIAVHVDAAIGGYILPFKKDASAWNFALPAVKTINISAHKYGLCLPGIGFLLVRDQSVIPAQYTGDIAYLAGGGVNDNALSCSRNAAFVINAHHNMMLYGKKGYTDITNQNYRTAKYLADNLKKIKGIDYVSLGDVPVVLFSAEDVHGLSNHLSEDGWIQSPHYIRAIKRHCVRIVVRKHLTEETMSELLDTMRAYQMQEKAVEKISAHPALSIA
jgi:glutamate decarboxylase